MSAVTSTQSSPEFAAQPDATSVSTQRVIAVASGVAGAIHVAVAPAHVREWWVFGAFFVVVGCFQLGFAAQMLRRATWSAVLAGVLVNLSVVLVWVASRTTGLPVGPASGGDSLVGAHSHTQSVANAHGIEAVGPADLAASAAELTVVCLLVTLLPSRLRRAAVNLVLVTAASLWVLRLSGALG